MTKKSKITVITLLCVTLLLASAALGLAIAAYNPPVHMGDFLNGQQISRIVCQGAAYPKQPEIELSTEERKKVFDAMRLTVLIDTRNNELPNGWGYNVIFFNDANVEVLFFTVSERFVSLRDQKGAGYESGGYLYSVIENIYSRAINVDY